MTRNYAKLRQATPSYAKLREATPGGGGKIRACAAVAWPGTGIGHCQPVETVVAREKKTECDDEVGELPLTFAQSSNSAGVGATAQPLHSGFAKAITSTGSVRKANAVLKLCFFAEFHRDGGMFAWRKESLMLPD